MKRLFEQFKPEHYELALNLDREKEIFSGKVVITGQKTGRPSQKITFHQNNLDIQGAIIARHDKKTTTELEVVRINKHKSFEEVRLHAKQMLYPGKYTITLEFKGKITRQMNGVYPCFFEHEGKEQKIIATQFESHHAREVFPCIDEPEAKATFRLTLTSPENEAVISNTPIEHQESIGGNAVQTAFETTPRMPTYLLAFIYGNLGYKEAKTARGTIMRTYATPAQVEFTQFALDVGVKTLEFYEDYFGIPYPLAKCDFIALPDFASGAMENWGAITFREQTMLVDPENTTLTNKQYVAMVVAHELAHQWFGNLVTMRWWTDLWLNEGFASWIEYLAVDYLFPDWQMWTQFNVDEQHRALRLDALQHTHPVEVEVHHPDEIRTIFDTISYSKGASVIHMLHNYLGAEAFRNGLRHYLNKHAYGNTDTIDLWSSLEEVSSRPVRQFMHTWTSQPGFPLVSATIEGTGVELTQERFYLNPLTKEKKSHNWPIPLLDKRSGSDSFSEQQYSISKIDPRTYKINGNQSGFYRTIYNTDHLERLGNLIQGGKLDALDRLGILSDLFEAARAGKVKTVTALDFLKFYEDENDNAVWDVMTSGIVSVRSVMDDETLRELMKPFIRKLTAKQLQRLGWEPKKTESHFDKLLRPTIIGLSASADEPSVVAESLRQFNAMRKPEEIAPDLRGAIYTTAVRHGDHKTYDKLWAIHESSDLSEERTTIAVALTSFKQSELVARALGSINSPSVRLQDVSYWIAYSFMNRFGKDATWKWMTKHWQWLADNLGSDLSFYRFPLYAATAYSDFAFLEDYKKFFMPRTEPAFERTINQGIEVITWQSAWKERDFNDILKFFNHS